MSFKAYLLESSQKKTIPQIVNQTANILSKKLGKKFYPYNKDGYQQLDSGGKKYDGYLFFTTAREGIRFNIIGGKFDSIEIWKPYLINKKSDWTIRLDGLNAIKIISLITNIIKKPSAGVIAVNKSMMESDENIAFYLNEARQIKDPHEFHHLAIRTFGDNKDHSKLSWDDIQHIANTHDVAVPGWVRNSKKKVGKGIFHYSAIPDTGGLGTEKKEKEGVQLYIKVTPQDPVTKKFMSVADSKEAQQMTSLIDAAINAPSKQEIQELVRDPDSLFGKMRSLVHLVIKGLRPALFIYGGAGVGKALSVDSLIKTPNGWKRMGDMRFGDEVITPKGEITKVIGVYPQGKLDSYEITFSDGRKVHASSDHLWGVYGGNHKKQLYEQYSVMTTEQIMKRSYKTNPLFVPLIEHEIKEDAILPLDPYVLGCLLGDGCFRHKSGISISSADQEILDNISDRLNEEYTLVKNGSSYDYSFVKKSRDKTLNSYVKTIDELNLHKHYSYEKFIPEIYKNETSKNQKLELIRGLMDTDGEVSKNGGIYYHTTSSQLKDDFVYLIRSIGGMAYVKEYNKTYTYKGEKKNGRTSYSIRVRYRSPKDLISLTRKLEKIFNNNQYKNQQLRIKNIEKLPYQEEMQCISVLDADKLYITNDYISTHNTWTVLDTLKKDGLTEGRDWFYQSGGKITALSLYNLLFTHREGGIQVFDDMDSVFDSPDMANMLKAALDSKPVREISWSSNRTFNVSKMSPEARERYNQMLQLNDFDPETGEPIDNDEDEYETDENGKEVKKKKEKKPTKLPSKFEFKGKIIFISNLPAQKVDRAVLTRAYQIDMSLTEKEMILRIKSLFPHILPNVPNELKEEVLEAIMKSKGMGEIDYVSVRNFEEACKVAASGIPDWKSLIPHI